MKPAQGLGLTAVLVVLSLQSISCQVQEVSGHDSVIVSPNDVYDAAEIINKTAAEILALRGFNTKVHFVRTADGHHIHVVHVINPLIKSSHLKRPVLFNHGLLESSTIWLINSRRVLAKPLPNDNLCSPIKLDQGTLNGPDLLNAPMMLANHGYDVWLMSLRGTDWSLGHDQYNSTQPEFWDYSLDDFGLRDIPAVIEHISRETGAPKVGYVGHSQATFSVFALLSTFPEYADKIEPVVAVAPVAYMDSTTSFARVFFLRALSSRTRNQHGPFPRNCIQIRQQMSNFCNRKGDKLGARFVCKLFEALIGGSGGGWRRGFFNHIPYFTSLKNMRHFGQLVKNKNFARYDYGPRNMEIYGRPNPPEYPVEKIRSRSIVLIWTRTDNLSSPRDVERFKKRLTVPVFKDLFIDKEFNHFDMITHEDCRQLVNAPMLEAFEHFEHETGVCSPRLETQQLDESNSIER